jgi:hypothetical protein
MLISHELGMVYLASPKTASKATRQFLEGLGFERDGGHHDPLVKHPGPSWTVFTAIRNHWDVWVSWYYFSEVWDRPFGVSWIERFAKRHERFITDDEMWGLHANIADRVMRFENLENDLASLLRQPVVLPLVNLGVARKATKKRHYSEFYDEATRDYVGRRWKHEIERYGYSYSHGGKDG